MSSLAGKLAELEKEVFELLQEKHTLTAEIARLNGEVDGWKADAERHCRNEIYYTGLLDEIAKNFGRAAYTSDDGSIQQDPLRAKMPELVATLRTRLDALVTAVRGFADRNYTFIDNTCAVSYKDIRLLRDALSAAVREAKEKE